MRTSATNRRDMLRMSGFAITVGMASSFPAGASEPAGKPKSPMPPADVYSGAPLVDEIALSPDGNRIAIVTQQGDKKLLMHFTLTDTQPYSIVLGEGKVRGLMWSDNNHVLVTSSATDSLSGFVGNTHEFYQAFSINVDTGKAKLFFDNQPDFYPIVQGGVRRIKVDGEYRVTAANVNIDRPITRCLYSFGPEQTRGKLIYQGSEDISGWLVTPDGFLLARTEFIEEDKIWRLHYNSGTPGSSNFKLIYEVKGETEYPSLIGLGRDGKSVVVFISDSETDGEYYEISADGKLSPPLDDKHDSRDRGALFHPVTKRLAGFSRHDDWFVYDYFDPLMKKLAEALPVVMGADYRVSFEDFAEDPRKMILYGEGASDAGSYYFCDFTTGDVKQLAVNYENLPAEWITQKSPIAYKAADGLNIHGYLTLPPFRAAKNLPLIVLPHGGPESRDYVGFDWQVQVLASRGYAVLQPNFRGSDGYGKAFVEAGHGEWGRKMQTDLSDGVRWLAGQGIVDPKRVAILGASYGGYAAMAGATLDPGVYNCSVAIAGVSDLQAMIDFEANQSNTGGHSTVVKYWKRFFGDQSGYADISPALQAAKAYCPLLLIHGTDDTVVPIDQSRRMEKALKAAGKPVEFVTYKGQDHWETVGSSRVDMMKAALDFLMRHNPPDAIPA